MVWNIPHRHVVGNHVRAWPFDIIVAVGRGDACRYSCCDLSSDAPLPHVDARVCVIFVAVDAWDNDILVWLVDMRNGDLRVDALCDAHVYIRPGGYCHRVI